MGKEGIWDRKFSKVMMNEAMQTGKLKKIILKTVREKGPLGTDHVARFLRMANIDYGGPIQLFRLIRQLIAAGKLKVGPQGELDVPNAGPRTKSNDNLAKFLAGHQGFNNLTHAHELWFPQIEELQKYIPAINKRIGSKVTDWLGSGTHGVAYSLSDGRVLKITDDKTEVTASAHVEKSDNKYPNIVRIYDVFEIDDLGLYGIVMEKLDECPNDLETAVWEVSSFFHDGEQAETFKDALRTLKKGSKLSKKSQEAMEQLLRGMYDLKELGIHYRDLHPGNVGIKGKIMKIMDLGYSQSPQVGVPRISNESFKDWYYIVSVDKLAVLE